MLGINSSQSSHVSAIGYDEGFELELYHGSFATSVAIKFFTITAEIHARSLVNFYCQYADRDIVKVVWIHSSFDNVMTKFMINNRTDA